MIEMVVATVNQCSKIQKPPKRHNDALEALCQHLPETFFHVFPQKVEVMLLCCEFSLNQGKITSQSINDAVILSPDSS